ncbi:hypothetical protein D3C75_1175940 [compost metagenome]
MRVPRTTGHQQHWLMLQIADGARYIQRVGHHHQAGLTPKFRDHGGSGAATVDDDPRVLANALYRSAGNGLLVGRHRLRRLAEHFLRHRYRAAVATQ